MQNEIIHCLWGHKALAANDARQTKQNWSTMNNSRSALQHVGKFVIASVLGISFTFKGLENAPQGMSFQMKPR